MRAGDHPPVNAGTRRLLGLLLAPLLLATVAGLALLWPTGDGVRLRPTGRALDATVVRVRESACADTAPEAGIRCATTEVRLGNGAPATLAEQPAGGKVLRTGERVVVTRRTEAGGTDIYELAGRQRRQPLTIVALTAVALVLVVARGRGARLLLALAVAAIVLGVFAVPSVLHGHAPLAVAVVAAAVVATAVVTLGHGVNARSATALAGTLLGVGAAGLAGKLVVDAAHLAGIGSADPTVLRVASGSIPTAGLLLGGVVLGAVGAIAEVAVRLVDATWDLRDAAPDAGFHGITLAGIRLGGRALADVLTTLALAYAGVALPLFVLLSAGDQRVVDALSGETLGVELGRALAGTIALAVTVPVTAAIAAVVVVRERTAERPEGDPRRFRSRRERRVWNDDAG